MIDLGQMDRNGKLYSRTPLVRPSGANSYTETFVTNLYLTQVRVPVNTVMVAQKDTEVADVIFRTRWFEGLENGMYLVVEGATYRITRRDELGRREGWQIYGRTAQ